MPWDSSALAVRGKAVRLDETNGFMVELRHEKDFGFLHGIGKRQERWPYVQECAIVKRVLFLLCCGLFLCVQAEENADIKENPVLKSASGYVGAEIASAYLGSSGAIYDTNPITSQEVGWLFDFGEYGRIDGYFWIVSSLHDRQHESHRMLFSEFETVIRYGQSWRVAENAVLKASAGPLWNPAIGYKGAHRNTWGPYVTAYLDNPVVVPYMSGLWILSPKMRGRIRFGVRRTFTLSEHFDLTPSVETVWMDRRRFDSRYGAEPEDSFLGGSFATVTTGVKLSWQITENWQSYFRFQMFDVINSQARRAVKKQDAYYAKCDWPIFKLGVEYSF